MATLRDVFMVVGAVMAVVGSVAIVALEFSSSSERRLVSRFRDTVEVLLPPVLMVVLTWLVWLERS